ncbi:hypothetical protein [Planobispora takensis]|uniref:hypothetical protein n=1 Tax=Planobispora takensis TaxID=1367882 RepID=UPI001942E045|nr:hypothetical protein [Planobispora takensis]
MKIIVPPSVGGPGVDRRSRPALLEGSRKILEFAVTNPQDRHSYLMNHPKGTEK